MKRYTEHPVFGQKKTRKEIDHHTSLCQAQE
jgi:hypothetical protein